MICKVCLGKGWILNENYTERIECPACHGTKETDPTNEDWFCGLSTEEKAKWLADNFGFVAYKASGGNPKRIKEDLVEYWQEWLKQPHTPIS